MITRNFSKVWWEIRALTADSGLPVTLSRGAFGSDVTGLRFSGVSSR